MEGIGNGSLYPARSKLPGAQPAARPPSCLLARHEPRSPAGLFLDQFLAGPQSMDAARAAGALRSHRGSIMHERADPAGGLANGYADGIRRMDD